MYKSGFVGIILFRRDIKPDTDLLWVNINGDVKIINKDEWENIEIEESVSYRFISPVYTNNYADNALEVINRQEEIQESVNCIRYDDDQYEDPSLWHANEELEKIQEKGLFNKLYWEYQKYSRKRIV